MVRGHVEICTLCPQFIRTRPQSISQILWGWHNNLPSHPECIWISLDGPGCSISRTTWVHHYVPFREHLGTQCIIESAASDKSVVVVAALQTVHLSLGTIDCMVTGCQIACANCSNRHRNSNTTATFSQEFVWHVVPFLLGRVRILRLQVFQHGVVLPRSWIDYTVPPC